MIKEAMLYETLSDKSIKWQSVCPQVQNFRFTIRILRPKAE